MHMTDALLSPEVGLTAAAGAAGLVAWTARRAAAEPQHARRIPLMGVMAAFVFAAQMINFAIPGTGSSGHIAGGLLLAIVLGPYAAFIALTSVLAIQCLLFADGGLLALGCNILNLAFWPSFVGLPLYKLICGGERERTEIGREQERTSLRPTFAAVLAAVASLQLGATGVVIETVLAGRSELPLMEFGAAMLGIHLPIAIIEGLVTAGVLRVVSRATEGFHPAERAPKLFSPALVALALATLATGGVLAWYASEKPDGLEWSIARVTGSEQPAATPPPTALLPDYQLPNSSPRLGLSIAGITGAAVVALVVVLAATLSGNRKSQIANRKFP